MLILEISVLRACLVNAMFTFHSVLVVAIVPNSYIFKYSKLHLFESHLAQIHTPHIDTMELSTTAPPAPSRSPTATTRKRTLDAIDSHSAPVRSKKAAQPDDVPTLLINDVPAYVNGTVSAREPLSSFKAKECNGAATTVPVSVPTSTVAGDGEEACSSSSSTTAVSAH